MNKCCDITFNLHKVVFLLDKRADRELQDKLGITFSQFKIVTAIDHKDVSQKDIASYWDMTEAAVSRQIELLLEKHIVAKEENKDNRREHKLTLTQSGKKLLDQGQEVIERGLEDIYNTLTKEERDTVNGVLQKLLSVLCSKNTCC